LNEVLVSLFPALDLADDDEPDTMATPTEVGTRLVVAMFGTDGDFVSSSASDLLMLLEVLIDKGVEPPWDQFAGSFLEDLLNSMSHHDLPLTRADVDAMLGPKTSLAASALDKAWIPLPTDAQPRTMDLATYRSVENPDLKWILRCGFRRTSDDIFVGLDDLLRLEVGRG